MSSVSGSCRLALSISGKRYRIAICDRPNADRVRIWLTNPDGERYLVESGPRRNTCSCPYRTHKLARCKHLLALAALNLIFDAPIPSK
jgi:hypothetical protein